MQKSFRARLSIVTYNIWNTQRWDAREPALRQFVATIDPDILCLQELRQETRDCLDDAMPQHARVQDEFPGWCCQSNIYWRRELFTEVEHGTQDIGILEKHRRLFWVRLRLAGSDRTVFVSTAHLTYQGNTDERETGHSPRVEQTRRIIQALRGLIGRDEPGIFTGDLNDPYLPMRMLLEAGYANCFAGLGILPDPTHPCIPTVNTAPRLAPQAIDWIVANERARSIAALVPRFYHGDVAPSDHWPVLAVYELHDQD
jgi:endonuclease/exonuclease/phosphatase family metal-dependent hydrolase